MVLGSKDETGGCQGCTAALTDDGSLSPSGEAALSLRLRLPNSLALGGSKHLLIEGLRFAYGRENIEAALFAGSALTYRFKRDEKGWRVFVSTSVEASKIVPSLAAGAIGVDINAGCLGVSEADRFGNLTRSRVVPCVIYGKTSDQRKAVIGDAVKAVVDRAVEAGKPLAVEKLDFSKKKKAELEKTDPGHTRMISALAYAQIQGMLRAAAFRAGAGVIEANPAFTSVIGAVNYAQRFGISVHQAAALVIARRALGFNERPAMRDGAVAPTRNGGHVTFALPKRNRAKHVWSFLPKLRTGLNVKRRMQRMPGQGD